MRATAPNIRRSVLDCWKNQPGDWTRTMINGGLILIVASIVAAAPVRVADAQVPAKPAPVPRTVVQFDLPSKSTNRTYRVQIFRPAVPAPTAGYPVIFLTDGALTFETAVDQMWSRQMVDLKPAIVVGIGYPGDDLWEFVRLRNLDLIPWKPTGAFLPIFEGWAKAGGYTVDDAGGAEQFYRFITEELRPKLASMMPVDLTNQALFGHSLGGLFTLYSLFEHPAAFSTYVVSSPSILFNARAIVASEAKLAAKIGKGEVQPRILLEVGSDETYPSSEALAAMAPAEQLRWAQMGRAVDNTLEMAARLRSFKGGAGYQVRSHVFEGENHVSVVPSSVARGLSFAFSLLPDR